MSPQLLGREQSDVDRIRGAGLLSETHPMTTHGERVERTRPRVLPDRIVRDDDHGVARLRGMLCELAAKRGLRVDMHCDETDDPLSRHIETLSHETQRLGLHGRVTGSHLTSMHSMDNHYVSKLLPLMAESGMHAVANPLINIVLQGRRDSYPKRRGNTLTFCPLFAQAMGNGIRVRRSGSCGTMGRRRQIRG